MEIESPIAAGQTTIKKLISSRNANLILGGRNLKTGERFAQSSQFNFSTVESGSQIAKNNVLSLYLMSFRIWLFASGGSIVKVRVAD